MDETELDASQGSVENGGNVERLELAVGSPSPNLKLFVADCNSDSDDADFDLPPLSRSSSLSSDDSESWGWDLDQSTIDNKDQGIVLDKRFEEIATNDGEDAWDENPWPCTHTIISLTPFYTIVFVHLPDWSSACYIPSCEFDLDLTPAIFVIEAEDDDSCLTVHERARPMVTYDDTRLGVCRKASESRHVPDLEDDELEQAATAKWGSSSSSPTATEDDEDYDPIGAMPGWVERGDDPFGCN